MESRGVKLGVVIVAGGSGTRLGGQTPKQFLFLEQLPVLAHSINRFAQAYPTSEIVVVLPSSHLDYWCNLSARLPIAEHKTTVGGEQRYHSVKAGIAALSPSVDIIAVHDGARPLVSGELIQRATEQATSQGSAIPAVELFDSVRILGDDSQQSTHFDRARLRAVQTPQTFDAVTLRRAYNGEWREEYTDDASVVEASGEQVYLCQGERQNIKITTIEDIDYARYMMQSKNEEGAAE